MKVWKPSDPASVRTGVLTWSEYLALDTRSALEVEEMTAASAARPGHDAAWFAKNRDGIRENFGFFLGIALSGTSYKK
jgi:hypothetical protein